MCQMVVWVALSKVQREIYSTYLGGRNVKDVLEGKVPSPLAAISHLKKVTHHGRMYSKVARVNSKTFCKADPILGTARLDASRVPMSGMTHIAPRRWVRADGG